MDLFCHGLLFIFFSLCILDVITFDSLLMGTNNFKIASLNVRGFRDFQKRVKVNILFKAHNIDVLFIQESHCSNIKEAKHWENCFSGKGFWSFGQNHSCGVGIILNSNMTYKVLHFDFDYKGRYVVLDLLLNNIEFRLINVYMPNIHAERRSFISDLSVYLNTKKNIVLGGDFNFVQNVCLDKEGGNVGMGDIGKVEMGVLQSDFHIVDIFRHLYTKEKQFTWEGNVGAAKVRCRLDRFYISKGLISSALKVTHIPVINTVSDHDMVVFDLQLSSASDCIGPGFWKCNVSILKNKDLGDDIFRLWERELKSLDVISSETWDGFKLKCKQIIQFHSRRLNDIKFQKYKTLHRKFLKLRQLNKNNPGVCESELQCCELEINNFFKEYNDGCKIRAKIKKLDFDEKPSRFFLNRERKIADNKVIDILEVRNGLLVTKYKDIIHHVRAFYEQLFHKEEVDQSLVDYFLKDLPVLTQENLKLCEGLLSREECFHALTHMKNYKSPGIDGLPKEFYEMFWSFLGDSFVKMANYCFREGKLSKTQRVGVITLICKNKEKSHLLNFWRPISLLCVDYKIISKSITNRVKKVMGNLINIDQTAAVVGRSIQDNIHLLRNVINYSQQKGLKTIILSLDQAKAFDRVSHDFMFAALQKYGFGEDLINWVKLLYTDIYSMVLVNGFLTDPFPVLRSVRQGCSLSPLLYVLCIEPFACRIREDFHIQGFKIGNSGAESRISMYADDCSFTVMNLSSVSKILNISEIYGLASGAKLNKQKCWGLLLGNWGDIKKDLYGIQWTKVSVKICGVKFGNNDFVNETWDGVWGKFKNVIKLNNIRNLRLFGKGVVVNVLALSKLWYVAAVFPIESKIIDKFTSEIFSFLWGNKTECLKREVLFNRCNQGGINLVNIAIKIQAFSVLHISKFLYGDYCKWKDIALYWLKLDLRQYLDPVFVSNNIPFSYTKPQFYKCALLNFKNFVAKFPNIDIQSLTVKKIYTLLLRDDIKIPRIVNVFPQINFDRVFTNISNNALSSEARDVSFRIAHHILPVNDYLCSMNIVKSPLCVFCKSKRESLAHLFYECPFTNPLWTYISFLLAKIASSTVTVNCNNVIFSVFQKSSNDSLNLIYLLFISEAKWSIWYCRNLHKFEEKNVNNTYIKSVFKNTLKLRILADHKRLPLLEFQNLWCSNNVLCKVYDGKVEFCF